MSKPSSGRSTPEVTIDHGLQGSEQKLTVGGPTADQLESAAKGFLAPPGSSADPATAPRTGSGRSSRQTSPARMPTDIVLGIKTQMSRLQNMQSILDESIDDWSLDNIDDLQVEINNLESIHAEFKEAHHYFELNWPPAFIDHEYFRDDIHGTEAKLHRKCLKALTKLRSSFAAEAAQAALAASESKCAPKLPDIQLTSFTGEYSDWPRFKEMFEELIMKNPSISDIERLHYLRSCMSAGPAELIANYPLTGSSLKASWQVLVSRYDNKRLLIQAQLDKMCSLTKLTKKSAKGLNALISRVSDACKALDALGVNDNLGGCILVHHVCHHLDSATREGWENSLGSSSEYPSFAMLEEFLTVRARALERIEASAQPAANSLQAAKPASAHQASAKPAPAKPLRDPNAYHCDCCNGSHYIITCHKFQALDVMGRRKIASNCRLCFNCLGRHSSAACRSTKTCRHCGHKHHTMLHEEPSRKPAPTLALIETTRVRALVDPGSELSFISEQLTKKLNSRRLPSTIPIIGIGGETTTRTQGLTTIILRSLHSTNSASITAHILKKVTSVLPSFHSSRQTWPHLNNLELADPDFMVPRPVDIIIGADAYGQIIKPNLVKHSSTMPIAQLSIFGWLILGPVHSSSSPACTAYHASTQTSDSELQTLLTKFWIQEEMPSDPEGVLTKEDQECEDHFKRTHSRDPTGRYIVRLPLNSSPAALGSSYAAAHWCLKRTLRKLQKDDQYRDLYKNFMREYEDLGHMVRIPQSSASASQRGECNARNSDEEMTLAPAASQAAGGLRVSSDGSTASTHPHVAFYLPNHGVLRPDSTTTKLRVVFNGSCPTTSGRSLNDIMHTGQNLLPDITDVLTWIRHHRHIFATDITKMYRQIKVHDDDCDLQRILWIDDDDKETHFQLKTVTYGTRAAPFLAVRVLLQLLEDEGHRFPLAIPSLLKGRYVDDIFGGADSVEQLIDIANELKELCHAGGFPLAKWQSTHPKLLSAISASKAPASTISFDDCSTKILGLRWNARADEFSFAARFATNAKIATKRQILSEVAQIFDPLGFISPVTIRAKVLIQELWLQKIGWDAPLSPTILARWHIIREDLQELANISIPRWFNTWSSSTVELHGFSDASQLVMSAVVYLVVNCPSTGASSTLVCAKTRVAPLKQLTIPRLELAAALLLSKLARRTQETLQLPIRQTHLWTDSQVTLSWINAPASRWKDYVRNRVLQIQQLSPLAHWRHVPGTSNPADGPSRGLTTHQLKDHPLWWTGPPWLIKPQEKWPRQPLTTDDFVVPEARPGIALFSAAPKLEYHWDLIHRYSSLQRLIRITAICQTAVRRMRKQPAAANVTILAPEETEAARILWVKATQALYFAHEIKVLSSHSALHKNHAFSRLTAFLDHEGVIRVGGRLTRSALSPESKHQAILPRHSRLTELIIANSHLRTLHGGTQLTLADVRQSYWILGGRAPVKSHILHCVKCARQRGTRAQQLMGQLPAARVSQFRPFTNTGLDYAGPLTIRTWKGRGAKTTKGWICVFVCLTSSAVHLEAVSDYTTDGFIAVYRRFVARRGIPHVLHSDCGTNFVGADTALKRMFTDSTREHHAIATQLSQDKTLWRFNPPAAPHMGGKWEAVVKSVKFHLRRTVGEIVLTFEELATLLSQIEATLNSRPLEPLSDDPDDVSALTPGHFLTGAALSTLPEASLTELKLGHLHRWRLIQQRFQHFWKQWSAHYLQHLQSIAKWRHPAHHIKEGSLVLITDERFPPSKWPLARVIAVHPGQDGLTRVVTLRTASTTLTRPIAKLSPLPIS